MGLCGDEEEEGEEVKQLLRTFVFVSLLTTMCAVAALPITDVVAASDKWNQQSISMEGRLCLDGSEVYLASTSECDEIKEEKEGGFRVTLVMTKGQYAQARAIKNGANVVVTGVFRIPPSGAIRMTRGILLGYSIEVSSISPSS